MQKTGIGRGLVAGFVLFLAFAWIGTTALTAADTTPPVLTITSPPNGTLTSDSNITVTGTASDALSGLASVTCNNDTVAVQPDTTFSKNVALLDGFNALTFIARDNAGNTRQQVLNVVRQCANLVQDPGFEAGVSGFTAQDASSHVSQTDVSPLEGAHSLHIDINGWGNNLWWDYMAGGKLGTRFSVSAHLRSDVASSSTLKFCAFVNYSNGTQGQSCASVSGAVGDKGIVGAVLALSSTKALRSVDLRMYQEGSAGVQFTVDSVMACLTLNSPPPPPPPPPSVPTISAVAAPAANSNGWNNAAVTVTFTCSDSTSGIATCPSPVVVNTDGAGQVVSGIAVNNAGNTASTSVTLNIDRGAPTVTASRSAPPNTNGWNNTPITVSFTCSDGGSGIATCPAPVVVNAEGAGQVVSGTAVDKAGNTASVSAMVKLDATPPAVSITSPTDGSVVSSDTITLTGSASDTLSGIATITCNGQPITLLSDNTFSNGPYTLVEGLNTFTILAIDAAGNTRQQTVSVTRPCTNLVQDPGFETGVSGFTAQDASSSVTQTDISPLEGAHSLRIAINGYGNNLWWIYGFPGGTASRFSVSAHLRSDVASSSTLQFCAFVEYADGSNDQNCAPVSGTAGDKGIVSATLNVDSTKALNTVRIRFNQEGREGVQFTVDSVVACLAVVSPPASGGGTGGGGGSGSGGGGGTGGGGGGGGGQPGPSHYSPGYNYLDHMPAQRPFISLSNWTQVDQTSTAYQLFKASVDSAVSGNPPYAYSAADSVIMYAIAGQAQYINDAISRVEQQVTAAEAAIASGGVPEISGDSYLEVGPDIEELALAYDYGYDRLSDSQRQHWENYAQQAIFNVWNSNQASWGGVAHTWSGWATNDPGDNYHYSFLKATMLWALATKSSDWFNFLQTQKFGPVVDYFYSLPGGGSREGTGYGVAIRNLFDDYIYWKASTGEDLSAYSTHARDSIDYWVHATVPTLDRYAPIGDLSRQSYPWLYDYHENLVQAAAALNPATAQSGRGVWWLANNKRDNISVPGQTVPLDAAHAQRSNLRDFLLAQPDPAVAPTDLSYTATAAGVFFTRSSWDANASWLELVAGKYDQSHAHQNQGSFAFFKQDWLSVTSNVWSFSGIYQDTDAQNIIRFVQNGTIIPQNQSDSVASNMTVTNNAGMVEVQADLTNAYSNNSSLIQSWTRDFQFQGNVLRIHDLCTIAPGVQPIFQLHTPAQPVVQPDGTIVAGHLRVLPPQTANVSVVAMPAVSSDFTAGYRIDLTLPSGCDFSVELQAQ
jgi:hypothetical protein